MQIIDGTHNELINKNVIDYKLYYRYLDYLDARPKTIETYTKALKQFFNYLQFNNIKFPLRQDIINFREQLKFTGHKPTTIQNYITVVKLFFRWTDEEQLYPNISEHIKGAKIDIEHKKDYLTSNQVRNVLNVVNGEDIENLRNYAILVLMITCGLRTIEVVRADIGDIQLMGDNMILYVQGKGHDEKSDFVNLSKQCQDSIFKYLKLRENKSDVNPLFTSLANKNKEQRMTTRSVSRIVKNSLIKAGYESNRLSAHSLRHTTATLNLINGGSLEETQQLLRHNNINTTMVYVHLLDKFKNDSSERISKVIFG